MKHIKIFVMMLALLAPETMSTVACNSTASQTNKTANQEMEELIKILSDRKTQGDDRKAGLKRLVSLMSSSGLYIQDITAFDEISYEYSHNITFNREYKLLETLKKYNKVIPVEQRSTLSKNVIDILMKIEDRYSYMYAEYYKEQSIPCDYDKVEDFIEYGAEIVNLIDDIILKNIAHFTDDYLIRKLGYCGCDKSTCTKIAQYVIDRIKSKKYKPDIYKIANILSSPYINQDQTEYILGYIKANHNTISGFVYCMEACGKNYNIGYDFLRSMFDALDKASWKDGVYNPDLIMCVFDLFTCRMTGVTAVTEKIHRLAQELLIQNLDKIATDKLSQILTARYLNDDVGKKVSDIFITKITDGSYKPTFTDLIYAMYSMYINDKQRSAILDMITKTYDKNIMGEIEKLHSNLLSHRWHDGKQHRLHGYDDEDIVVGEFGYDALIAHIMCGCRYFTKDQGRQALDFVNQNCNLNTIFIAHLCSHLYGNHVTDKQMQALFDRVLESDNRVWAVALHNSATDEQRIRAVKKIMSIGDTACFIRAAIRKLKRPLKPQCEQGKCTEGKKPCCMASVNRYMAEPNRRVPWYDDEADKYIPYQKFDGIAKWPLKDDFCYVNHKAITDKNLKHYLENIDSLDLNIMCRIIRYCDIDKKTNKMVFGKIKSLERYLVLKDIELLITSKNTPNSYKKKLVKRAMKDHIGSRTLVACKQVSSKDAIYIFKDCNRHTYDGWSCATYFKEYYHNAMFNDKALYSTYADKYMAVLQSWIDKGDPERSGETLYMKLGISGGGWGDSSRDAYCGCNDILCELSDILKQGDLPNKQRKKLFKYLCYYFDRFLYFAGDIKRCSYYYSEAGGWSLPAVYRVNNLLCYKYTTEQYVELFKIIAKYVDKFDHKDIVSYLASDVIPQECKDILWNALREKKIELPDEAVRFLDRCGVTVTSMQGETK